MILGCECWECERRREFRPWAEDEKPVVDMHIWTVALDMRSKASRHASAGGHFSIRSPRTEVAARMVKSTSSMVYFVSWGLEKRGKNLPSGFEQSGNAR